MQAPVAVPQVAFSRGEVDPLIAARTDLATANTSLRRAYNFIVHPQGAVSNRGGSIHVAAVKNAAAPVIVKEFAYNDDIQYCMEIGVKYIRFFRLDATAVLNSNNTPYEVSTIFTANDIYQLKFNQSADVLYIYHQDYPIYELRRVAVDAFTFVSMNVLNGPFLSVNKDETMRMTIGSLSMISSSKPYFTAGMVGSLMRIAHTEQSQEISHQVPESQATVSGVLWTSAAVLCGANARWQILTSGSWEANIVMQRSFDKTNWEDIRILNSVVSANYNIVGAFDSDYWLRFAIQDWTQVSSDSKRILNFTFSIDSYTFDLILKITGRISQYSANFTVQNNLLDQNIILNTSTDDWSEGAWSDKNGYPRCGCFYQDRHILGGSKFNQQGVWMSQTGYYNDFGVSSPLVDSDAISTNIPSRKINTVHNLMPMADILALTSDSETVIIAEGAVMTPTTTRPKPQTYRGSKEAVPMIIGNRVIYVQRGGYLRDIAYNFGDDGYDGDNLRLFATHLFEGHEIIDIVYQQEPHSIIWAVRDDGKLCLLTYLREQQILAWTLCETQGKVKAVCALKQKNFDEIWAVVERASGTFIERFAERNFIQGVKDGVFLDCASVFENHTGETLSGLDRFNGQTITVLNDGNVETGTVANGIYKLKNSGNVPKKIIAGLPYVSELETLNIAAAEFGSRKGKIFRIDVDFYNSRGGRIGTDWSKLDEIWQRTTEALGEPTKLYSDKYIMTPESTNEIYKSVKIRQDMPLPMTITAITPHLDAAS
ncbi:MAG: hypothetical protein LBD46_08485 [Endomicrobium sp.]|nr:hypothetical protein [Endomicrobium sp.]